MAQEPEMILNLRTGVVMAAVPVIAFVFNIGLAPADQRGILVLQWLPVLIGLAIALPMIFTKPRARETAAPEAV